MIITVSYPLTGEQKYFYSYQQKAPDSTMYNMCPLLMKLQDWVDAEKFAGVLRESLKIHTAMSYVTDGERQHYVPDLYNITVEHMSEDDFMTLKDNLIQPFYLQGAGHYADLG